MPSRRSSASRGKSPSRSDENLKGDADWFLQKEAVLSWTSSPDSSFHCAVVIHGNTFNHHPGGSTSSNISGFLQLFPNWLECHLYFTEMCCDTSYKRYMAGVICYGDQGLKWAAGPPSTPRFFWKPCVQRVNIALCFLCQDTSWQHICCVVNLIRFYCK